VIAALLPPVSLQAFPLQLGDAQGSWDTTVSVGAIHRLSDPSPALYGTAAGGLQNSVNYDDGNLNYLQGLASLAVKATTELELAQGPFTLFVRGTGFYDFENENGDRARTPLSDEALEKVGSDVRLLDYFVVGRFDLGDRPSTSSTRLTSRASARPAPN
jgi:hypothetical protein